MADNRTVFQRLTDVVIGAGTSPSLQGNTFASTTYTLEPKNKVIASFSSKEERDKNLLQLRQQKLQSYLWKKIGYETSMEQISGANQVRVMYRDADLMDQWPEINAALHILAEESTTINKKGKMLNVYSKSDRIQSILEDLFINRLDINIMLPMIIRSTCKYGNEFMFLNIDMENGIRGWRELPVHEMRRLENGMQNAYGGMSNAGYNVYNLQPDEVKFVWEGHNEQMPFKNWQIAHFRLLKDSLYLPYGVSWLNGARRHWRMLSMMEDGMLIYRLERSIERRMFKVNVASIDDADVPAFLQEFANNIKRAPIVDPQTGQIDLRKNFLDVSADYFIPVRDGQDPTNIEPLQSVNNQTSMDDINYMENKILAALRIPKSFLNFQEAQGKGQNLSLMDIRFNRTVNAVQQAILMELNKIAIIHLCTLGFDRSEWSNFTLSMNNPSNQIEMMELDNLTKRLGAAAAAVAEQGGGLPIMSWKQMQREIMGKTDKEIADMLNDIRLEMALAAELQQTSQIIKRTHLFDKTDRIYGEPGAEYQAQPQGGEGGPMGGGGAMGGGAPMMGGDDFGNDLGDLGEPGADDMGSIGGEEGSTDLSSMGGEANESPRQLSRGNIILESLRRNFNNYIDTLEDKENILERAPIADKAFMLNEDINTMIQNIEKITEESKKILNE